MGVKKDRPGKVVRFIRQDGKSVKIIKLSEESYLVEECKYLLGIRIGKSIYPYDNYEQAEEHYTGFKTDMMYKRIY